MFWEACGLAMLVWIIAEFKNIAVVLMVLEYSAWEIESSFGRKQASTVVM